MLAQANATAPLSPAKKIMCIVGRVMRFRNSSGSCTGSLSVSLSVVVWGGRGGWEVWGVFVWGVWDGWGVWGGFVWGRWGVIGWGGKEGWGVLVVLLLVVLFVFAL